jgi:hypothetical protein
MSDLDQKEQNHVRAALRFLHRRIGTWTATAEALHFSPKMIEFVVSGRRSVSASLALRVARLAGVMVDDLLGGRFLPPGACPHCGYVPEPGFTDEPTIVENTPRAAAGAGLTLVKSAG